MVVPMCSTFNLMQSCEKQLNHGSLEGVNALSGCSVLLFDEQTPSELSNEEINDACDILFYTINWFREVLNSFINAADEDLSQTLLLRLRNILELELRLGDYLKQTPTYAPLEFHNTLSMALKEDTIKSSQILSTEISINGSEEQENPIRPNTKKENKLLSMTFKTVNELRSYMRPFNLQVFEIFKHNSNKLQMTHDEINYILDDLDKKLDIKIVPLPVLPFAKKKTVTENKIPPSNITLLARTDSGNFMRQVVPSLPYILRVLEDLYAELQEKVAIQHETQGAEKITSAISYIVNALYKLLSWPHISSSDNKDILESIVGSLAERISGESKTRPEAQNRHAFQYLSNYGESMPQSATAVILFKTLLRLIELSNSHTSLRQGALVVATHIVSTPWYDWRDIKKDTEFLVEQTVELSDDPLQVLHELVNNVLPRFESEGILEDHPLLKQDTSVQYYQAIINQIVKSFDLFRNTDREPEITLVQNGRAVKIFERITHYVKVKEQRLLTAVLLKTGKNFIDQFTKHSIPYFSQIFKTYRTNILVILKDLQASTRVLQIICSHVKVLKDISLSAYVPPLKKSLENVIYQVKMLVTRNGIPSSAFFMGALKHRDISGAEISSQIPREEDDDENESAVDEIALSDHEEAEDSPTTDKSTRRNENPNRSPAKRKKTPRVTESRKKQKSDVNIDHRTSSQVPSSSEDEASRSEEEIVRQDSSEENMEADAEGDEILEFDLNSNSVDEESEEERSTLSHPSYLYFFSLKKMSLHNPLASLEQLETTISRKSGISEDLEEDLRNFGAELIQSAGILLKLPQVAMATAQVLFQRFFYMASLKDYGIMVC
ncbi:Fanconi anemia protein FancD2 nuclease-domain-containing protein [Sporodiniella umbellata]|nr:Fanconi anemia protein FancD2 nuclease-domain-containing protein [Sporodiniella umbellata]